MATKKKSTALAKRGSASSDAALTRMSNKELIVEVRSLRTEQAETRQAMMMLAEKMASLEKSMVEAPPPLFKLATDVMHLESHDVVLVEIEIENSGQRDLTIETCTLVCGGTPRRPMPKEYGDDVDVEGDVIWARGGEVLFSGCIQTYLWAFEAPNEAVDAEANVRVRIGGQDIVESKVVRAFESQAIPTDRKAPKLLTGGAPSTQIAKCPGCRRALSPPQQAGSACPHCGAAVYFGEAPTEAVLNQSTWRRG